MLATAVSGEEDLGPEVNNKPQSLALVERFNRTLKTMIRKFVHEDAKNWDR